MNGTLFSSEGALLFVIFGVVALGLWLQRFKVFKTLGPALTVIVTDIVLSNLKVVPTSSATYDAVSNYCVPLSVSICLLSLDLHQMRKLTKEPVISLISAVCCVCLVALVFGVVFAGKIDEGWKVSGMFVGTYTGGSSNLTAIAVGLNAAKTTIASANAADYVVGIPTMILMFAVPAIYKGSKKLWPYDMPQEELAGEGGHEELMASKEWSIQEIAGLLAIGFGTVYCPSREMVTLLVREGFEERTLLRQWRQAWPEEKLFAVTYAGAFDVPMRDGAALSADVYLPAGGEKVPAVLVRTPYGKEGGREVYYRYVQRGYAVVIQDVRGRNKSGGEWVPNYYEVEDGDDTLNWIAAQPWSSGSVGMVGGSYLGYVQWAAAASGNPHLKALISVVCAGSAFVDVPRRGGSLNSGMLAWAFSVSQKTFKPELMERDDWQEVLRIRPLSDIPKKALGYEVPFLDQWFQPRDNDGFWNRSDWQAHSQGTQIPALIQSGWFDDNGMGTTQALELVHDFPAEKRKVILGPWQHSGNSKYDMHGVSFGSQALRFDLDLLYFRWFERYLKGVENGVDREAPVEYYTLGQEQWKTAENWPVPATTERALYLTGSGHANTSAGDGQLTWQAPAQEGRDSYRYDPQDPATHIVDMSENELEVPEDYTQEEQRQDILCYTTPPLSEDVTITGDMTAELYISSDAPDTDFVVRVTDVDQNGRSIKLADGVLSARYRNGFEKAEFLEEGEIACLKIRTTKLSNCFRKGHRIRVTVTSGAENFIFSNSNTREGYNSAVTVVAENTLYHGGAHASKLIVRVEE